MVTAKFNGTDIDTVYGLTQWDYGQDLAIDAGFDIQDGTEVQFYQGALGILRYLRDGKVMIPDVMLQDSQTIIAYVYVRTDSAGETVLTARLHITAREKPTDYVLPDTQEYRRLLPEGGEPGQVPVRESGPDYAVGWGHKADSLEMVDGYIQLLSSGNKIGERVRINMSEREIELTNDGTNIKWRYTDSNVWIVLASLESLKGPPGDAPEFEIREGHLYAIYK